MKSQAVLLAWSLGLGTIGLGCCSSAEECEGTLQVEGKTYPVKGRGPNGAVEDGCRQHCGQKTPSEPACVRACQSKVAGTTPFGLKATCK